MIPESDLWYPVHVTGVPRPYKAYVHRRTGRWEELLSDAPADAQITEHAIFVEFREDSDIALSDLINSGQLWEPDAGGCVVA